MDLLEAHDEHRAVRLGEEGRADLDDVVGANGEEEAIERGVVELAQCDAVADDRLALGVAVGRDMRGVEELLMAQPTEGAALGVRANDPLAEGGLVEPAAKGVGHIRAPRLGGVLTDGAGPDEFAISDR